MCPASMLRGGEVEPERDWSRLDGALPSGPNGGAHASPNGKVGRGALSERYCPCVTERISIRTKVVTGARF